MATAAAFKRVPELQSFVLDGAEQTGRHLGTGSFGSVMELKIGGVLCAGKKLHDILTDPRNEGATCIESKFLEECKLMSEVRHPHIAQFLGICFLSPSPTPLLVTELLSDSLHNVLESRDDLPLRVKQSILADVAKGLVYLHCRAPPIIHRDLTARNVLLDTTMRAKITDFGNSRFIDPKKHSKTMTRIPGTLEYMPPEALETRSPYSAKLDIFSFGHLALYTITQVFPENILAATSPAPDTDEVIARSEVARRAQYMELLYDKLKDSHPLVALIKQCLHNSPSKRPTALEALDWLEGAHSLDNPEDDEDDHYETLYDRLNKAEMVEYMNRKELEKKRKEQEIENLRKLIDNRASIYIEGVPEAGDDKKTAPLEKFSKGKKQWKLYTFKIVNGTHLKYFKSGVKKPRGEILLSHVKDVFAVGSSGERFCFEIHFMSKEAPWLLSAFSETERTSWIEAIGKKQAPRMKACLAYGMLPLDSDVLTESENFYDEVPAVNQPDPTTQSPPTHADNDSAYDYIPFHPHRSPSQSSRGEKHPVAHSDNVASTALYQNLPLGDDIPEPPYDVPFQSPKPPPLPPKPTTMGKTQPVASNGHVASDVDYYNLPPYGSQRGPASEVGPSPSKKVPAAATQEVEDPDYEETVAMLDRTASFLNASQIKELISMLQSAQGSSGKEGEKGGNNESEVCKNSEEIPRPPSTSPPPLETDDIDVDLYPEVLEPECSHNNPDIYDTIPIVAPQKSPTTKHQPPPTPPKPVFAKKPLAKPPIRPKPQSHPVSKQNLKKMWKETTALRNESLLITEDDSPDEYILRPQWAKAATLYSRLDTLSAFHLKTLYISPSALTNICEVGEGQFGKVYKGLMKKAQQRIQVAVKVVDNVSPDFQKEITIMSEIIHPNIVRLYGLMNEGPWAPAMIMEFLPNGDLKNFLTENKRDNRQLTKYMLDVAMGMHYLSEKGIIHRDLAARNILVDKSEMCKVADFGLVREVPKETPVYVSQNRGPSPLRWMAPESIADRVFSHASDVWSFGILQWEMFNPKTIPYPNIITNESMTLKVANGYRMPTPRGRPPLVIKIMRACWNKDPVKRPSFFLISNLLAKEIMGED